MPDSSFNKDTGGLTGKSSLQQGKTQNTVVLYPPGGGRQEVPVERVNELVHAGWGTGNLEQTNQIRSQPAPTPTPSYSDEYKQAIKSEQEAIASGAKPIIGSVGDFRGIVGYQRTTAVQPKFSQEQINDFNQGAMSPNPNQAQKVDINALRESSPFTPEKPVTGMSFNVPVSINRNFGSTITTTYSKSENESERPVNLNLDELGRFLINPPSYFAGKAIESTEIGRKLIQSGASTAEGFLSNLIQQGADIASGNPAKSLKEGLVEWIPRARKDYTEYASLAGSLFVGALAGEAGGSLIGGLKGKAINYKYYKSPDFFTEDMILDLPSGSSAINTKTSSLVVKVRGGFLNDVLPGSKQSVSSIGFEDLSGVVKDGKIAFSTESLFFNKETGAVKGKYGKGTGLIEELGSTPEGSEMTRKVALIKVFEKKYSLFDTGKPRQTESLLTNLEVKSSERPYTRTGMIERSLFSGETSGKILKLNKAGNEASFFRIDEKFTGEKTYIPKIKEDYIANEMMRSEMDILGKYQERYGQNVGKTPATFEEVFRSTFKKGEPKYGIKYRKPGKSYKPSPSPKEDTLSSLFSENAKELPKPYKERIGSTRSERIIEKGIYNKNMEFLPKPYQERVPGVRTRGMIREGEQRGNVLKVQKELPSPFKEAPSGKSNLISIVEEKHTAVAKQISKESLRGLRLGRSKMLVRETKTFTASRLRSARASEYQPTERMGKAVFSGMMGRGTGKVRLSDESLFKTYQKWSANEPHPYEKLGRTQNDLGTNIFKERMKEREKINTRTRERERTSEKYGSRTRNEVSLLNNTELKQELSRSQKNKLTELQRGKNEESLSQLNRNMMKEISFTQQRNRYAPYRRETPPEERTPEPPLFPSKENEERKTKGKRKAKSKALSRKFAYTPTFAGLFAPKSKTKRENRPTFFTGSEIRSL